MKPRFHKAIDLFCGAGGATKGLQRAGFEVLGVDINPQPNYCGEMFIKCDALKALIDELRWADLVWASPPCQKFCALNTREDVIQRLIDEPGMTWRRAAKILGPPCSVSSLRRHFTRTK